jgi:hypothetical protein
MDENKPLDCILANFPLHFQCIMTNKLLLLLLPDHQSRVLRYKKIFVSLKVPFLEYFMILIYTFFIFIFYAYGLLTNKQINE